MFTPNTVLEYILIKLSPIAYISKAIQIRKLFKSFLVIGIHLYSFQYSVV